MSFVRSTSSLREIDYIYRLQKMFDLLYTIKRPEPTLIESTSSFVWGLIGYAEPLELSEQEQVHFDNAAAEIELMQLATGRAEAKKICSDAFKAYELLTQGCLEQNAKLVKYGIAVLDRMPIAHPEKKTIFKKAVLNLKYINPSKDKTHNTLGTLGLFGYAATQFATDIVKQLLAAGANPHTVYARTHTPLIFHIVKTLSTYQESLFGVLLGPKFIIVPYLSMREIIRAFLENKFNLATTHKEQNILECVLPSNLLDIQYPAFLIVKAIAHFYDLKKIDPESFNNFCEALRKKGILKYFPSLVTRFAKYEYNTETDPKAQIYISEKNFHELKYMVAALIAFCSYQLQRLEHSFLSQIGLAEKQKTLKEGLNTLKEFESKYFNSGQRNQPSYRNCWMDVVSLTRELITQLNTLEAIFITNRIPAERSLPQTALDWEAFSQDHENEIAAMRKFLASVELQEEPQIIGYRI